MHKSRLAGFIIDCRIDDADGLDAAAEFWAEALGSPVRQTADTGKSPYVELEVEEGESYFEVQKVDHESRVHIDIETDDIEAEVARLQALGAKRISELKTWVVMEAPTGQRFCVVPVVRGGFEEKANYWNT
jgi:predicted enzyme related to lactoylglutathione lyase